MTSSENAYALAMELQSLTFDMCMLEDARASAFRLRYEIECHLVDGVYAEGSDNRERMVASAKALKDLEDRCEEAILVMSKRDQEIVWKLSGRTSEVPEVYECPFCGGEARLIDWTEAYISEAYACVECTRCEAVRGPYSTAVEFHGMCNPWRSPPRHEEAKDTLKGARIEAVTRWNRRVYGGKALPEGLCMAPECKDWAVDGMEVRPCPLCGGDPGMIVNDEYYEDVWDAQIQCMSCGTTGPRAYGLDDTGEHPTLEHVRARYPDITILGSRKAAYLASIDGWNHRAYGREVVG